MDLERYIDKVFNRVNSATMEELDLGEDYVLSESSGVVFNRHETLVCNTMIPRNSILRVSGNEVLVLTKDLSLTLEYNENFHLVCHKLDEVRVRGKSLFECNKIFSSNGSKHEVFILATLGLKPIKGMGVTC